MRLNQADKVISQFGRVRIQWDSVALNEILAQITRERAQHERGLDADKGEAVSNSLLDQAEQIKDNANATNPTNN